ncbi:hypothetical protein SeMB42_g05092 [Synchytrium endobioticum]|uniref:Transport and Golgi organization protein 2 n=1 Tax=Synchytrium endobioticum TaxID=286115 RepID=A0A507CTW3_9FUNG|nr:hypothetical protein SeMB42_g05092 [Synchytrium endobioticum]
MCVIFLIFGHPKYKLVVAANRDEFVDRPARRARFWDSAPHLIAGVDLGQARALTDFRNAEEGIFPSSSDILNSSIPTTQIVETAGEERSGTWVGMTTDGRLGFLTNYHNQELSLKLDAKTRGHLVRDYLVATPQPDTSEYVNAVHKGRCHYNGFNLVIGNFLHDDVWYVGMGGLHGRNVEKLEKDVCYGVSNGDMRCHEGGWWRVHLGRSRFRQAISESNSRHELVETLLRMLKDKTPAIDAGEYLRPQVGICVDREMSPRKNYGTRTHTVIVVENNGDCTFLEEDRYMLKMGADEDGGPNIEHGAWRNYFEFKVDLDGDGGGGGSSSRHS